MKRRTFIQTTAALSAAGLLTFKPVLAKGLLNKIGVQLFSLPKLLEKDFRGAIQLLAKIGYSEIEMFGPYPFSADSVKAMWTSVTPALGFSGSGYFGHTPQEVQAILKENKISVPAVHADLDTLQTRMAQLGEASRTLGFTYVGLPALPEPRRKSLDDYRKAADEFNAIGAAAKKEGLKFSYHNHGYGLKEVDGKIPLQIILENTDPHLVFMEMDLYWTVAGGADPVALLEAHPNRYHLMHVKDMKEKVRFSGDGGNPQQWIELFPYMTSAGSGVLDLKTILTAAKKNGVKHFFVEQDIVADPEIALKKSFDYLKGL